MKKLLFVAAIVLAACGGKSTRDTLKPGQKQHVRLDPVNPKAMLDFESQGVKNARDIYVAMQREVSKAEST